MSGLTNFKQSNEHLLSNLIQGRGVLALFCFTVNLKVMKKLLLVLSFLSVANVLFAQEDQEPTFKLPRAVMKIAPLQFFLSTLEVGVEVFNPTYSKSFNLSAGFRSGANGYNEGTGASVELAYRNYAAPMKYRARNNRESYQGIYYSLFVRGEYFKEDDDYEYWETTFSITPGFTLGFQKTLWKVLLLDVYVGGGIKFSDVEYATTPPPYESSYGILDPGYSGICPRIGAKVGMGL